MLTAVLVQIVRSMTPPNQNLSLAPLAALFTGKLLKARFALNGRKRIVADGFNAYSGAW